MNYWERKEKLFRYTEGARQYFPLAYEQLDTMARIIDKFRPYPSTFLDLGCGDGFVGNFIFELFPDAKGVFLDGSAEMISKAKMNGQSSNTSFVVQDFSEPDWRQSLGSSTSFDLIVSGYSIHHIENEQKKRLFNDIYQLLNPGGLFLNLEHVSSPSENLVDLFENLFDDRMMEYQKDINDEKTREEIREMYHDPEHELLNKLESVELQCEWLRDIGFREVDCYLKIFELALFGGVKGSI